MATATEKGKGKSAAEGKVIDQRVMLAGSHNTEAERGYNTEDNQSNDNSNVLFDDWLWRMKDDRDL